MVPYKDGKANRGHSCVKGRFAWGYANHRERILKPMIRDKISEPWREVSWEEAIGRVASEFKRIQATYGRGSIGGITSSRCTDEETFLVQKLVRADLRQQQCRYLRARLPLADRLRPEHHLRNLGWNAGFRFRRAYRRCDHHRRQSDRRASGVRLTHEEAAAPGRQAHRHRSAADRSRPHAARGSGLSPAAPARHQRRHADRAGACHRHRRPGQREVRPRALRLGRVPGLGGVRRRGAQQPGGGRRRFPAFRPRRSAARRGSTPPAATARSITASASPSTARARPRSWRSPISPWRPATSAGPASA